MLLPFCKESTNFSFDQLSLCLVSAEPISTLGALLHSGGSHWNLGLVIIQEEILDTRTALVGKEKIRIASVSLYLTASSAEKCIKHRASIQWCVFRDPSWAAVLFGSGARRARINLKLCLDMSFFFHMFVFKPDKLYYTVTKFLWLTGGLEGVSPPLFYTGPWQNPALPAGFFLLEEMINDRSLRIFPQSPAAWIATTSSM